VAAAASLLLLLCVQHPSLALRASEGRQDELVVGIKETPPFAYKDNQGAWRGVSIDLWREIATELGLKYRFKEVDLQGMLDGLKDRSLDVTVGALTVTREREESFDFSHPFYTSGLGIAVVPRQSGGVWGFIVSLFSFRFLSAIVALGFVLFLVGFLIWIFERKKNPDEFGGSVIKGLGAGFWWSSVTMTTVGYGDKSPKSVGGRIIAIVWMFGSIIVISGFIAGIASSLTLSQLESPVQGPSDLVKVRVGTVKASTSADYLRGERVTFREYADPAAAIKALADGKVDAAVYDEPILRHIAKESYPGDIQILPQTFQRQDYAYGLQQDSALREKINRVLIGRVNSDWWQDVLYTYMGR